MKFVFTLGSILLTNLLFANSVDSVRVERRADGMYVIHQVEDQETIYSIARRYGGSVASIISDNEIVDSRIEIGEEIAVKIQKEQPAQTQVIEPSAASAVGKHVVAPGETLYSISRKYDVKIKQLRKWNNLEDNSISPGMLLRISESSSSTQMAEVPTDPTSVERNVDEVGTTDTVEVASDPYADFEKYFVQTGETLHTIAARIGVKLDSLRNWNRLDGDFLRIGQELFFRKEMASEPNKLNEPKKKLRTQIDRDGFERVFQEGIVSTIESMQTTKFLALHQNLPIGTDLEVRNLMNNQVVYVKVVGKLPDTGLNKNLLLRISKPAYEQLGILDSKSRVEVSYQKN